MWSPKISHLFQAKTSSAASSPQPDNAALEQLATREKEVQTLQMSLMSNQNVIQNLQANLAAKDKDIQALQQVRPSFHSTLLPSICLNSGQLRPAHFGSMVFLPPHPTS